MKRLFVVADDLTGTLDTAVQFVKQGISVYVCNTSVTEMPSEALDASVVVACVPTRHLKAQEAYQAVKHSVCSAIKLGFSHFFKKVDSTLRGNIGAELTALLETCQSNSLCFFPAYPELGRTTREGTQYINHIPIDKSAFGNDPFEPVTESYIPNIIAAQSSIDCQVITSCHLPESPQKRILIFDSTSKQDLLQYVQFAHHNNLLRVVAGCAGLAEILCNVLSFPRRSVAAPFLLPSLLVVCGSVHPVTLEQISHAQHSHRFRSFSLPSASSADFSEVEKQIPAILHAHFSGQPIIITIKRSKGETLEPEHRARTACYLGKTVRLLWENGLRSAIMATGGDTLESILQEMECTLIRPVKEIQPGVVFFEALCKGEFIPFVSKSGGFGSQDLISNLFNMLICEEEYA